MGTVFWNGKNLSQFPSVFSKKTLLPLMCTFDVLLESGW